MTQDQEQLIKTTYSNFELLLKAHNCNANDVCKKTKIASATMSDWKKGKTMLKVDKLIEIADLFNVSLDFIVGREIKPAITLDSRLSEKEESFILAYRSADQATKDSVLTVSMALLTQQNTQA